MKRATKYNILIATILVAGLIVGLLGYFGFLVFIENFPMNG